MRNKKYYPFRRNNYFYGKLLTVRDFQDEQRYINDKRRINNFLTSGAGVVCGLSVVKIDEKTISIESGMALDYMGREIIVEESVTKRLNVIDGFENLRDMNNVYLCLEYMECEEESVHSITGLGNDSDEKNNYNRISEGYHIFLTDIVSDTEILTPYFLMEESHILYNSNGIKITQITPKCSKINQKIEVKVIIEKIDLPKVIEVDYSCNLLNFKTIGGENTLRIYYRDEDISGYKTVQLTYEIVAGDIKDAKGYLEILPENGRITVGNINYAFETSVSISVEISLQDANKSVIKSHLMRHFDDVLNIGTENCIYLGKMRIIKYDNEYSIENFDFLPFNQYILNNNMLEMLINNNTLYKEVLKDISLEEMPAESNQNDKEHEKLIMQGEEIIEVDIRSKNKSYFSEEIAHGLGKGDILISAAIEDNNDSDYIFELNKSVFGDIGVFKGSQFALSLPEISVGVISYTDRGTFRVGIRFWEDCHIPSVKLKWWAVKNENKDDGNIAEVSNVNVHIEPNTISLTPREKYRFEAVVTGTSSKECRWSVTEDYGGHIDINGVYDAPTQEGVYEITAESVKYPGKKATAFVVVKEK